MILLRNPGSHPFSVLPSLLLAHAPPSATYQWVIQPKEEEENKSDAAAKKETDKSTEQLSTKEGTKKMPRSVRLPFSLAALAEGDFEVQQDEEGKFLLSTDLPGVKSGDLKVEFRDGALRVQAERRTRTGTTQRFVRHLPAIDEDSIDIAKLSATLEDGILSITVPMKKTDVEAAEDEPRKVSVKTESPPDIKEEDAGLNLEIDLPGVKVADLQVTYDAKLKRLNVTSERKSRQPIKTSEAYRLNTNKVDTSKMEAFLADGVLTIRAACKAHPIKIVAVNGHFPVAKAEKKAEEASTIADGDDSSKEDELAAKVE